MFGPLGFWEILFIVVLALLIFGPKKLPEVGRTVGRGMAEFRKATTDLKRTIENEVNLEELKPSLEGPRPVESAVDRTVGRPSHRGGDSSPESRDPGSSDTEPSNAESSSAESSSAESSSAETSSAESSSAETASVETASPVTQPASAD